MQGVVLLELQLFGTSHCHLCEQAEGELLALVDLGVCQVELVDIAEDEALMARYATSIPVLFHPESGSALYWPFDGQRLKSYLMSLKPTQEK